MHQLTPRQKEIFRLLQEHAAADHAPSIQELCTELGLRSRGSMHKHIRALVEMGLVLPANGRKRGIHLTPEALLEIDSLPVLGRIAAGRPIEAVNQEQRVQVPFELRRENCYVLEVRGDSMIDEGILDGDWVIVEHRGHARNGELVVALIDDHEATLKRIEQRPDAVILHASNEAYEPMRFEPQQVRIQGIVIGQMRRY